MIVSEEHRKLVEELRRLRDRLGVTAVAVLTPGEADSLHLVPALHAIVDRLEKLEHDCRAVMTQPMMVVSRSSGDDLRQAAVARMQPGDQGVVSHDRAVEVPTEVWNSLCGDVVALRERAEKLEARWAVLLGEKHGVQQSGLTLEEFRDMFGRPMGDHASTQNDDLPNQQLGQQQLGNVSRGGNL